MIKSLYSAKILFRFKINIEYLIIIYLMLTTKVFKFVINFSFTKIICWELLLKFIIKYFLLKFQFFNKKYYIFQIGSNNLVKQLMSET